MKRILITGATGMIGSAIIREAIKQNYEITCLVRKDSSRITNIPESLNVKIVDCNISEYSTLDLKDNFDISTLVVSLPFGTWEHMEEIFDFAITKIVILCTFFYMIFPMAR